MLVGSEAISNYGRAISAARGSYYVTDLNNLTVDPNLWTLNFGTSTSQSNSNIAVNGIQSPYESALFSLFGRLDYAFNDKYLLSATLRRDGSSVFAKDSRYGNFPSVTAGWRISQEKFMKNIPWLNDLKLRGGWGKLGSISNVSPTNAFTLFASNSVYSWYDINGTSTAPTQGLYTAQYGNPFTTWEEDVITNIGLDATLFKNKLELSLEWYKKDINGLLFQSSPAAQLVGSAIALGRDRGAVGINADGAGAGILRDRERLLGAAVGSGRRAVCVRRLRAPLSARLAGARLARGFTSGAVTVTGGSQSVSDAGAAAGADCAFASDCPSANVSAR